LTANADAAVVVSQRGRICYHLPVAGWLQGEVACERDGGQPRVGPAV